MQDVKTTAARLFNISLVCGGVLMGLSIGVNCGPLVVGVAALVALGGFVPLLAAAISLSVKGYFWKGGA